jgi:hypothetical protein
VSSLFCLDYQVWEVKFNFSVEPFDNGSVLHYSCMIMRTITITLHGLL